MERKINFVIKSNLGSGEILSKAGKNQDGELSIIFYVKQRPSGRLEQLKLDVQKLFGIVRSGTAVATQYSKELSAAVLKDVKDQTNPVIPSFSTPQALQVYLNSIKAGSCTLSDKGVTTKVNVEID